MKKWEDLCDRCGLCCHEKVVTDDFLLIDLSAPCRYLDPEKNLCTVYKDRFRTCSRCRKVTVFKACFSDSLPSSCAYVRWSKGHHIRFCRDIETVCSENASLDEN